MIIRLLGFCLVLVGLFGGLFLVGEANHKAKTVVAICFAVIVMSIGWSLIWL
jgi:uncharacterized membrane protein